MDLGLNFDVAINFEVTSFFFWRGEGGGSRVTENHLICDNTAETFINSPAAQLK